MVSSISCVIALAERAFFRVFIPAVAEFALKEQDKLLEALLLPYVEPREDVGLL